MTVNSDLFNPPTRRAKFNSACGLRSRPSRRRLPLRKTVPYFLITFAALACLHGNVRAADHALPCPPPAHVSATLGKASGLMQASQFVEAVDTLRPLAGSHCDPRVSLLLAAALEQSGDSPAAEQVLQQAHSVWPASNSIAASLARAYMDKRQVDRALQALQHFHATAATPEQEVELAAVVFLTGHQLVPAEAAAATGYRYYPSVHSLLLLANVMQLQGRFKEVVTLVGGKRNLYGGTPEFLITLAESEYDSILYDAARADLERALSIDGNSYQAHFLLANVLVKLDDTAAAITHYRSAIVLSPDQPRTHYQLALALLSKKDQAGAEQELATALRVDDHYAPALIEMGKLLLNEQRPSDAIRPLNLAVEDNPNAEQGYFLLAKAYSLLGDREKSDEMEKRMVAVRDANWRSAGKRGSELATNP